MSPTASQPDEQGELFPISGEQMKPVAAKKVQRARNKRYGKDEAKMKAVEKKRQRPTADGY